MVTYNAEMQTLHCDGCMETEEVRRNVANDPEVLFSMTERLKLEHSECASYNDPRMARLARRFRKRAKRLQLLEANRLLQYSGQFSA